MNIDFKVFELKESSRQYKRLISDSNSTNEFIIVGEKGQYFNAHQVEEKGICLIPGLSIVEFSLMILKDDLILKSVDFGTEVTEMDIPKQYLSVDIIETIQRLNT